jgi:hypothetical protein
MRVTALDALVSADVPAALFALEQAAGDPDRYVAAHARLRLDRIASDPEVLTA